MQLYSLSLSLSLWRLLSLQNCGDLLLAISFSLSEFKCEITFLWRMQEAGAERERERVADCSKSSSDQDASDQDASDDDGDIYIYRYRYIEIVPLSLSYRVSAQIAH